MSALNPWCEHPVARTRKPLKDLIRRTVKVMARFPVTRKVLNGAYHTLDSEEKRRFHVGVAAVFRDGSVRASPGTWEIRFAEKKIRMPLGRETFGLDWETAVSIVGHDIEIKQTYEALINSRTEKPDIFVDIGANYGTHSLLFLVHGIRTISIEPNDQCRADFNRMCAANGVTPAMDNVALGAKPGLVELAYPEQQTWLGSTRAETITRLSATAGLVRKLVPQRRLDDYFPQLNNARALIKIDTEGNELAVLQGGAMVLDQVRPMLVFESLPGDGRGELHDLLARHRYSVAALPYDPWRKIRPLSSRDFLTSSASNFAAHPN